MSRTTFIIRINDKDASKASVPKGYSTRELVLLDEHERLRFGLSAITGKCEKLGFTPSETAFDLLALAAAITAADTRVDRRTGQDRWTRELHIALPVRDPARWNAVSSTLVGMLGFLSGDRWSLSFHARPAGHNSLAPIPEVLRTWQPTEVSLFSGGLDSFIGAIDLLVAKKQPLFVSHYWDSDTAQTQSYCLDRLHHHYPKATTDSVRARIGFDKDALDGEERELSLRARSFLFFAMAAYTADGVGKPMSVCVPENGLISLNVPLDPLRLGSLSTRTTHPWYIARWNQLLQGLGLPVELYNPYRFKTKGEMAVECADKDVLQKELPHTMSCSSPNKQRWQGEGPKHCGHCVPCLIRRAAVKVAFARDFTPYAIKRLDERPLDSQKAEGEHIRSFQAAIARHAARPSLAKFAIHQPGPLIDHLDELGEYVRVYSAGLAEVQTLIKKVDVRPL